VQPGVRMLVRQSSVKHVRQHQENTVQDAEFAVESFSARGSDLRGATGGAGYDGAYDAIRRYAKAWRQQHGADGPRPCAAELRPR
jgi:hypothetical protein